MAVEVPYVQPKRMLATKLQAAQPTVSRSAPQQSLRLGHTPAKPPRVAQGQPRWIAADLLLRQVEVFKLWVLIHRTRLPSPNRPLQARHAPQDNVPLKNPLPLGEGRSPQATGVRARSPGCSPAAAARPEPSPPGRGSVAAGDRGEGPKAPVNPEQRLGLDSLQIHVYCSNNHRPHDN
jgi:hypothetical protein